MGKAGPTAKPFTQKHFGTKGNTTDDSHSMTKGGAAMMKQSAVYSYGKAPIKQSYSAKGPTRAGQGPEESREDYGKRVYNDAMKRSQEQQKNTKKNTRKNPKISYGMGSSYTSVRGPRVTSGMGRSFTTHNKGKK